MAFQIVQILYWLALATWFGGVLFVAIVARIVLRSVSEAKPVLPDVLSVNLDGQHGTLLAGRINENILKWFLSVELTCAGLLLLTMLAQPSVIDLTDNNGIAAILRAMLMIGATGMVMYDWWFVWPRIQRSRQQYLDHADEPETANPALDEYDRQQHLSENLLGAVIFLLLGIVLFSGSISPKRATSVSHESKESSAIVR